MGKASPDIDDPAMTKARAIWAEKQAAGWTQQRLGEAMGFPAATARQGVNQFFKARNPQIASLRKFAKAVGVAVSTLVRE